MENTINTWAEAIASLPDNDFFNIMRLYLGKIKTPYNKQRLASQLASFIKTPANTQAILAYLDSFDIEVLCAVNFISNPTLETIVQFFSDSYKQPQIYSKIENLKERLLIYTVQNQDEKRIFLINPILLPKFMPFLGLNHLLPVNPVVQKNCDDIFILSQNLLISFVSALQNYNFSIKADGTLKKNCLTAIEAVFPARSVCIQLLVNAFINLSLLHEGKKALEVDYEKLSVFAKLPQNFQYALLCAASCSRFSRDGLKKEAQLLLDCLASIPTDGFTKKALLRLAFLLGTKTDDGNALAANGRFSKILAAARQKDNIDAFQNVSLLDRMLDSAVEFGLLQKIGQNESNEDVFVSGTLQELPPEQNQVKPLNIESTFAVSLLPGLSLLNALKISKFLKIRHYGLVCQFELTRESASKAFDEGMSAQSIFEELERFTNYELPQNLKINIQEWYNSFSSILIYKGYVLKVKPEQTSFVENNPKIQKYLSEKLSDGVYLLNLPFDSDAQDFLLECGLSFVGKVRMPSIKHEVLSFPLLRDGKSFKIARDVQPVSCENERTSTQAFGVCEPNLKNQLDQSDFNSRAFIQRLNRKVSELELDKNRSQGLRNRILNKLIINESQLSNEAVRTEILEADGMDFAGKVHLIEAAQKYEDKIEIQIPDASGSGYATITGAAKSLEHIEGDCLLMLEVDGNDEPLKINVRRITHIRRLHF